MSHPNPEDPLAEDREVPSGESQTPSGETSFAELLEEFEQQHRLDPKPGELMQGKVIDVREDGVLVDVGLKREGMLPADQLGGRSIQAGDLVTVGVTGRTEDGYHLLSIVRVKRPTDWSSLEKAHSEGAVIGGIVREAIKGGLSVDVGARAFLPASRSGARDAAELEALVGQEIRCKVIQLDTEKEDVVVDRRVVLEEDASAARDRFFTSLNEGDVINGTVRGLTDFGAFVDLGGVDGLLHVADMAWTRVNKPSDMFSEGDSVEVKILKIDRETRRISLGRKQLIPDPWSEAAEKFPTGARVRGKVARLADFGAFVELEPGVDGLIHVSEMSWSKRVKKPSDLLKEGDVVDVVVLSVNAADRRIALGLKQALGDPWEEVDKRFPVGSIVEGPVTNLAKFGAFVELTEGLEGMIHIGDIVPDKRLNHPREALAQGQKVRAIVLEIDRGRKRIRLGMKQLAPTSADTYIAEHKPGDVVTGRLVEVGGANARVELGEGVVATCRIQKQKEGKSAEPKAASGKADLSQLTAMLADKWKRGAGGPSGSDASGVREGQIRSFRIVSLDPAQKRIEIELAG
ncbi:MAG: 30S ribosomal protein S1 [Bryobacteraceae bacterium]|nr:30S ribosomal protein S1 [Bryobacteraceae bacterium]